MWAVFFWLVGLVFLFFCFLFRGGVYARSSLLHRLVSSCGELGGAVVYSICRALAFSLQWLLLFRRMGSVVVTRGLGCS